MLKLQEANWRETSLSFDSLSLDLVGREKRKIGENCGWPLYAHKGQLLRVHTKCGKGFSLPANHLRCCMSPERITFVFGKPLLPLSSNTTAPPQLMFQPLTGAVHFLLDFLPSGLASEICLVNLLLDWTIYGQLGFSRQSVGKSECKEHF